MSNFFKNFIKKLVFTGVEGSFKTSENRGTLATNLIIIWGYFALIPLIPFLEANNISFTTYGIAMLSSACSSAFVFYFNSKKKYNIARFQTFIVICILGWNAAFVFGKSFNGIYYFFIALVYSFLLMSKLPRFFRILSYLIVFVSMPLVDYLSHSNLIPVTKLHSSDFSVMLLVIDTLFVNAIIATLLFVEKYYFDSQEDTLINMNENLEKLVEKRTALLLKSKLDNLKSDQIKAQFLANISHEVRIPVQGVMGFTDLAVQRIGKVRKKDSVEAIDIEKISYHLDGIKKSSDRLMSLLEKLFLLTREGNEAFTPAASEFGLSTVLDEIIENLDLKANDLNLNLNSLDTENIECYTDETFLRQSLRCLLENAIQYSDKGSDINVRVKQDLDIVTMFIENTGVGVDESDMEEIFNPFFQGSRTDKSVGGTGLGLSLCRKYIESINGEVSLTDNSRNRTQFTLKFPVKLKSQSEEHPGLSL